MILSGVYQLIRIFTNVREEAVESMGWVFYDLEKF
jgi:hypothetical protein